MWKRSHPLLAVMWQLIRNLGLVEAGESICEYSFPLVLETSQYPSGLGPEDVALFVRLDGEQPIVLSHNFSA